MSFSEVVLTVIATMIIIKSLPAIATIIAWVACYLYIEIRFAIDMRRIKNKQKKKQGIKK